MVVSEVVADEVGQETRGFPGTENHDWTAEEENDRRRVTVKKDGSR